MNPSGQVLKNQVTAVSSLLMSLWPSRSLPIQSQCGRKLNQEADSFRTNSVTIYNMVIAAAAAAKSLQSCLTLCNPIHGSPPGSAVPRILQARTLEWVAIPSPMQESEKWKWSRSVVSDSLRPHGLQPTRLLCPWDFPGKSTGVGCYCLLQQHGD